MVAKIKGNMNSNKLERIVKSYCNRIVKRIQNNRTKEKYVPLEYDRGSRSLKGKARKKQLPKFWDYPAVAVYGKWHNLLAGDISRDFRKGEVIANEYANRIKKLSWTIGKKPSNGKCNNVVGRCAEQHAANDLFRVDPRVNVNDVTFSPAIRPRTKEIILYCNNCKSIFPNI